MASNRNNKRVTFNGFNFDSQMEAYFYMCLLRQQEKGIVTKIELQPEFVLMPGFEKNGKKIRPIKYIADFRVYTSDGDIRIIDVKGMCDAQFRLKHKLFDYAYPHLNLELITMRPVKFGGLGLRGDVTDSRYWIELPELERLRKEEKKRAGK